MHRDSRQKLAVPIRRSACSPCRLRCWNASVGPFYNGSVGASLCVGQFADSALDTVSVGSAGGHGPVEERPGERVPS